MIQDFKYKIGKASDFSLTEISAFKSVVVSTGEVGSMTFDGLIEKNPTLLFNTKYNQYRSSRSTKNSK